MLTFDAATKALELDSSLNGARAFAITADPDNWSWIREIEALEDFLKAEPNNVNAMIALSYDLTMVGYFNDALANASNRVEKFQPYTWCLQIGFLDDYFEGVRKLRG